MAHAQACAQPQHAGPKPDTGRAALISPRPGAVVRCRKPPSQAWRTFLENHAQQLVSIDFFTVPTIRFQVLYVFLVLALVEDQESGLPTSRGSERNAVPARGVS
jgi:hypothetical protein